MKNIEYDTDGYAHIEENGLKYLLHKDGSKWRLATEIEELNDEIGAADFHGKKDSMLEMLYEFPRLEILILHGNRLENLPPEIGNFVNLKELELSSN